MKLRLLALAAFVFCLTGCFDVTETFNLKEDGSGTYELKMDMSRGFAMLAMMKQGAKEDGKAPQNLDSVIYYRSFVDTASNLTAEEKTAFKNGYANIHMKEEEGEMYVNMHFPFANGKELSVIQKALNKTGNGSVMDAVSNALKSGTGAPEGMGAMAGGTKQGDKADKKSPLPTSDFTYTIGVNSFGRKTNPPVAATEMKAKADDEEMPEQLKEMMKINYTTVVNLPRPAKSLTGKGTLSADKKQMKFTKSMSMDDKHTPAGFDFNIDY
jgi:hypothetical protein